MISSLIVVIIVSVAYFSSYGLFIYISAAYLVICISTEIMYILHYDIL